MKFLGRHVKLVFWAPKNTALSFRPPLVQINPIKFHSSLLILQGSVNRLGSQPLFTTPENRLPKIIS